MGAASATYSVTRLTLTDFRNYAHLRVEPARPLVALAGANGAGKTNLLEAVSLLMPGARLARRGICQASPGRVAPANGRSPPPVSHTRRRDAGGHGLAGR